MIERKYSEEQIWQLVATKIVEAEERMIQSFNDDMFSGGPCPELTFEERKLLQRRQRIRKLLAPWYWLRWRVVGTWNVWRYGECQGCDYDD